MSRVIVMLKPGWSADAEVKKLGGKLGRRLDLINGKVVELPNGQLRSLPTTRAWRASSTTVRPLGR